MAKGRTFFGKFCMMSSDMRVHPATHTKRGGNPTQRQPSLGLNKIYLAFEHLDILSLNLPCI